MNKTIGWIIRSPLILIAVGFLFCEVNKAYWDHQVKLMCHKDGGVVVYEHIELTPDEFKKLGGNEYGQIPLPVERLTKQEHPYYSEYTDILLHAGSLKVYKYVGKVFRKSDRKLLGQLITYGRGGGDFPTGIMHPSSFSCNNIHGFNSKIEQAIFTTKE